MYSLSLASQCEIVERGRVPRAAWERKGDCVARVKRGVWRVRRWAVRVFEGIVDGLE
jgi:hypothetical protein